MTTRDINLLPKFETAFVQESWDELITLLNPKLFKNLESEVLVGFPILAKVAQILTSEHPVVPSHIKIACLKCLGNSCFNGYIHKEYAPKDIEQGKFCQELYSFLANNENLKEPEVCSTYPFDSHFPYQGIIEWTLHFIVSYTADINLLDEELEILRLSIQFLCNLFTFAYKDSNFPDGCNAPKYLYDSNLKDAIVNATHSEHMPLVRASCVFIHNALKEFEGETFTDIEKVHLCSELLKPIQEGLESAKEALMLLLRRTNVLQRAYNDMSMENKLHLLQIMYNELTDLLDESKEECIFMKDTIEFLIDRFCRRSDIILKTADDPLDESEATEIVILLDILGILTSKSCKEYSFLKGYKSLLINCTYLLKSIQMIGKQSENYFTPLQKLSDVAPAMQRIRNNKLEEDVKGVETEENESGERLATTDLSSHPAFGFKAGLIKIIGNMSYRNKECQDLLREMDAIPLLLDCCNIDARNPFIMQWTILTLRNLCENNPANQEIIRNCTKVGVVESSVLREMGVTLHEDDEGKKIGIVPLPREGK